MNSLLENHLISISLRPRRTAVQQSCWEVLDCSKVLCPAHSRNRGDCWMIPRTHCTQMVHEDFFLKLASCLTCSYFRLRGEDHIEGWNVFIAEQFNRCNVKALERIYQKEESFIEILNRIPDGLFTTDREWRITYFNPAAERITGFSAQDAVGMYCKDVFKNTICETDCALKRAVSEGNPIHNREYEITDINGDPIPIICSTSAFQDATGRFTGGLEIFKDITQTKLLQAEVAKRERKYRRIFEGSHDMIYATNQPGQILDVNQAGVEMMGYGSKAELLRSINAQNFYRNPSDRERFLDTINAKGFVKDFEVDFVQRDGTPIHVLISSRRHENVETGEIEYEGIIKDITQRKKAEQIVQERNRELSILNSVAVALNNTMDLGHILRITLMDVLRVLRLSRGALFLIDRKKGEVQLQVKSGLPPKAPGEAGQIIFKDSVLEQHLVREKSLLTPKPTFPCFMVSYFTDGGEIAPWLSCFLITFKGKAVGFFAFDIPTHRRLNQHEIHLLGSLGNFLGGPIENARLMKTVRQHRRELRHLTDKLFQSQEEERRRIARELHDEAGQSLTAVKLALDRLEERFTHDNKGLRREVLEIRRMINRTSSEIRRLSYHLHPTLLIDLGLEPALTLFFNEFKARCDMQIFFEMVGFDQRLDVDTETVFYRFSQEAFNNTLKHAAARSFRLSIIKSYPKIIFLAEDDGVGFDPQIVGEDPGSLGLLGMRERASLLGGKLQLRSRPGAGTRIRIEIPLSREPAHV